MPNWLDSLSGDTRHSVIQVMRRIRCEADSASDNYRQLAPCFGEIEVGGGAFDEFVRADSLSEFLSALAKGYVPADAVETAKTHARLCVSKWNQRRGKDYQTHRSPETMDAKLMDVFRAVLHASETK